MTETDKATTKTARPQSEASIRAVDVHKSFTVGTVTTQVLTGVDLDLFPGELTLMLGPSGSGKSTMLAILGGILKPDSGKVVSLDTDVFALPERELDNFRLLHCGFIFQGFNLFPALDAMQQVQMILNYYDLPRKEIPGLCESALEEVGLANRKHLRPAELSSGEKQRVAIARSLVRHPSLIFADEPTSALDTANGRRIVELLQRAAHQRQATVLVVTHDARLMDFADRVVRLQDGRIVSDERFEAAEASAAESK